MDCQNTNAPLAARLGLKPGMRVWFHAMPLELRAAIAPEAAGIEELACASDGLQAAMLFIADCDELSRELAAVRRLIDANGFAWIARRHGANSAADEARIAAIAARHGLIACDDWTLDGDWALVKLIPVGSSKGV